MCFRNNLQAMPFDLRSASPVHFAKSDARNTRKLTEMTDALADNHAPGGIDCASSSLRSFKLAALDWLQSFLAQVPMAV